MNFQGVVLVSIQLCKTSIPIFVINLASCPFFSTSMTPSRGKPCPYRKIGLGADYKFDTHLSVMHCISFVFDLNMPGSLLFYNLLNLMARRVHFCDQ